MTGGCKTLIPTRLHTHDHTYTQMHEITEKRQPDADAEQKQKGQLYSHTSPQLHIHESAAIITGRAVPR